MVMLLMMEVSLSFSFPIDAIVLARGEFSMTCIIATGSSSAKGGVTKFIMIAAQFPIDYMTNPDEHYSRKIKLS